jgi:hypothetical protein
MTRKRRSASSLQAMLLVVCVSCVVAAGAREGRLQPLHQGKDEVLETEKLEDLLKSLGPVIEGNSAEVGQRAGRFDSYKYDDYRFKECMICWREKHESSEAGKLLSKESSEFNISLKSLNQESVRVDEIGASAYIVSFTTLKLKETIRARVRTTYEDGSEHDSGRLAIGTGICFQNEDIARRVAKVLVVGIKRCQKGKLTSD